MGRSDSVAQPAILMELVDLLGERLAALDRPVCLMVDGIAPTVAHGVFGSLRNELWALHGAALGRRRRQRCRGRSTWSRLRDAFFERHRQAWPADRRRRGEAVARPRTRARRHRHRARDRGGRGQPAATAASRRATSRRASRRSGRRPTSSRSGPPQSRVRSPARSWDTSRAHGPAAASDETMLRQIGASRQRASQLMHAARVRRAA